MIREDKFLISRPLYAVDLSSLHVVERPRDSGPSYYEAQVRRAVWFRRKNGVTAACTGRLWDLQDERAADAVMFLRNHTDGRYGGDCTSRWDGSRYWGAQEPDVIAAHLDLLRPMLAAYPEIPPGFDGWWRFA